MNLVLQIGRLTRDPEVSYTTNNDPITRFTIAVDRPPRKDTGEKKADFIRITVFGGQADVCAKYLKKGRAVAVQGRIQTGQYQDKNTGETKYTQDVIANRIEFLDWGGQNQNQQAAQTNQQPAPAQQPMPQQVPQQPMPQPMPQTMPEGQMPQPAPQPQQQYAPQPGYAQQPMPQQVPQQPIPQQAPQQPMPGVQPGYEPAPQMQAPVGEPDPFQGIDDDIPF